MAAARVERRLAAILAADVAGYSRLMERDEAGTLARLKAHRKELVEPLIAEHRGRVVKLMGDGALCEFASAVDAVECAVAIQEGMAGRELDRPEAERLRFRIGVNVGDVIAEGGEIYGDGVNVAARLEGLAEPGGVCISGKVHEEIRGRLDGLGFEDLGERALKNIARPVRVWRVIDAAAAVSRRLAAILPVADHNLPQPNATFVGRTAELEALQRAISEYERFIQDVWGPQGKAAQENERSTQEIVSQIRSAVEKIAADRQLDLVLDAASGFIIYADRNLDLTAVVLTELAARSTGSTPR